MKKDILKVKVKDGFEQDFERYCRENGIYCKAYPLEILKTRYRVDCKREQLIGAKAYIISVEDMPMVTLDHTNIKID